MTNSRRKGAKAELELAKKLTAMGLPSRRTAQATGVFGTPDVDVLHLQGELHVECKRDEKRTIHKAIEQAVRDATDGAVPVVCHRKSREPWLLTVRLDDLWELVRLLSGFSPHPPGPALGYLLDGEDPAQEPPPES